MLEPVETIANRLARLPFCSDILCPWLPIPTLPLHSRALRTQVVATDGQSLRLNRSGAPANPVSWHAGAGQVAGVLQVRRDRSFR